MKKDGFKYVKTPTNDKHISYLKALPNIVTGVSLNSDLYTGNQEKQKNEHDEQESDDNISVGQLDEIHEQLKSDDDKQDKESESDQRY